MSPAFSYEFAKNSLPIREFPSHNDEPLTVVDFLWCQFNLHLFLESHGYANIANMATVHYAQLSWAFFGFPTTDAQMGTHLLFWSNLNFTMGRPNIVNHLAVLMNPSHC